jgi:hypothetical protein
MTAHLLPLILILLVSQNSFSAGNYGVNGAFGIPYIIQGGVNYVDLPNNFSAELRLNFFTISAGVASVRLTKPEINAKWHPFQGAFFLGLGLGHQIATVTASEPNTGAGVKFSVSSTVATTSLGWMWGLGSPGLFGGFDFGWQNPYHVYTTVDSDIPTNDEAYEDAEDAARKFGEMGLPLVTLIRIGYLF